MSDNNDIRIFNRFKFVTEITAELRKIQCDLATYRPKYSYSHVRSTNVIPQEYAILGPVIDTTTKRFGIVFGPKPRSKVLCNVETTFTNDTADICSITFSVYGQQNLEQVTKIVEEIYAPRLITTPILITVISNEEEYERLPSD